MPFGMWNASAAIKRAKARALQKIVKREESMVMAYIDAIMIACVRFLCVYAKPASKCEWPHVILLNLKSSACVA